MLCPKCKVEMAAKRIYYKISLVNEQPQLILIHEMTCRNEKCKNYEKVVKEVETPIDAVIDNGTETTE